MITRSSQYFSLYVLRKSLRRTFAVSTTVTDLSVGKTDILARVNNIGRFPWRDAPSQSSMWLWRKISIFQVKVLLTMAQWNKPFMKFSDVSPGAIAAFHSATDSIFMHHLMQLHKSQLIHNSTESSKIEPPARLQELFAPDLAAFYQYAVEQHCLKAKRLCHYALENVTSAKIRDIQWYGGAPLCNEGIEVGWIVPGINIFKLTGTLRDNAPLQKFNTIGDFANYVRQYIDTNKVLVRISVEVECRETFAITDLETGDVVQGDLNPRTAKHHLLLENVMNAHDYADNTGWTITDIDDWLEGNQYWIKDRLSPPRNTGTGTGTGTDDTSSTAS